MIKAFVFDIGDTIEPSTMFKIENLEELIKEYKLPEFFKDTYLEMDKYHEPHMCHAQGEPKIMKMTLDKLGLNYNHEKLSKKMQTKYWAKLIDYYTKEELGKEFVEVIKFLREKNYKTAILSDNSIEAKNRYLEIWKNVGLKFDAFVVSAEVGVEKPSMEIFQTVLDRLEIKPSNAVYFGDNLKRDSAVINCGWNFVWVYGFIKDSFVKDLQPKVNLNEFKEKKIEFKKIEFITREEINSYLDYLKSSSSHT